jgi:hypothetical protein
MTASGHWSLGFDHFPEIPGRHGPALNPES